MNKKRMLIALLLLFLAGAGFFAVFASFRKKEPVIEEEKKQIVLEEFNKLSIEKRPYVMLYPSVSGGEIYLSLDNSSDRLLEYEIEYQAVNEEGGTMIQGGMGRIDLSAVTQPTQPKEFCFCSESKGKKKYDSGVSGGTVILRFSGGEEDYNLKGDFAIGSAEEKEGVFSTRDAIAVLDAGQSLSDSTVVIAADAFGLPFPADRKILAGPYGFFANPEIDYELESGEISFRVKGNSENAEILYADDNAKWTALESELTENTVSAKAPSLGVYLLVE